MKPKIRGSIGGIKFTRKTGDIVHIVADDFINVETGMVVSVTESTVVVLIDNQERKIPPSLAEILLMDSYEKACSRCHETSKWATPVRNHPPTKTKP